MLKRWTALKVFGVLALALTACGPSAVPVPTATKAPAAVPAGTAVPTKAPAATSTPKPTTVTYGSGLNMGAIGILLAKERGYFQEQGITLEPVPTNSTSEALPLLTTGKLDVISGAINRGLLEAAERAIEIRSVADMGQSRPNWEWNWVVVRKDLADSGQVKKPADLKGAKIAVNGVGGVGEQTIRRMLEQAGLKQSDVDIVVMPFADQTVALANKAIAAAYTSEPQIAVLLQQALAVKWLPVSSFFGGTVQLTTVTYGPTMLKDQELGRRWMIGFLQGVRDYNKAMTTREGRQQMIEVLSRYTAVKDPKMYEVAEWPYIDPNGLIDKKSQDEQYRWLVDTGQYKGKTSQDAITDTSYAEYAVQKLGKQ